MKAAALSHCCLPATRVAMCLLALHLSIRERTCTNLILSNCMISLLGKPRSDVSSLSELPKLCDVTMISTESFRSMIPLPGFPGSAIMSSPLPTRILLVASLGQTTRSATDIQCCIASEHFTFSHNG